MNKTTMVTIAKVSVKVISLAASAAVSYFAEKELDDKIAKKVAEAVTKNSNGEV